MFQNEEDVRMALAIGNSDISNELWQSALNTLEQNFSKPVFEMWIKPMRFVEYREDELHLAVHSKFAREWVGTKLQGQIIEVLREIFGSELELKLSVAEPGDPRICAAPISTFATRFKSSSSATPTGSRTPLHKRLPAPRHARTTRFSCTAAWVWAKPT
jgi:chromosomal replication initiation ATPase DnaA